MGHQLDEQAALFCEFSLERHVPSNHLLRSIDRFVELDGLRRELSAFYSTIGRPSIEASIDRAVVQPFGATASLPTLSQHLVGSTDKLRCRLHNRAFG
jgi:hypothetical protein